MASSILSKLAGLFGAIFGLVLIVGGIAMLSQKSGYGGFIILAAGVMILPRVFTRLRDMVGGRGWIVGLASLVMALVIGPLSLGNNKEKPSLADKHLAQSVATQERTAKACNNDTAAYVMSQSFVKEALKSPSTAVFPPITDANVVVPQPCKFIVTAFVDSQNSFGATVRSKYVASLALDSASERWSLASISIE